MKMVSTIVVFGFFVSVSPLVAQQDPAAGVRQALADWAAACNKADAQAIGAAYTTDALLLLGDGTRKDGKAAITAYFEGLFAGPWKGVKCTVAVSVVRTLKADIAIGHGTGLFEVPGQPAARGFWQITFVRQGTKWLIASDTGVTPPGK